MASVKGTQVAVQDPGPGIVLGWLAKIVDALGIQEAWVEPELRTDRTLSRTQKPRARGQEDG